MASKRMAISALLSSDASPSRSKPSSPAPAPAPPPPPACDDPEPPHKRQRHAQAYSQQYYESYNAYPYASSTPRTTAQPTSSAQTATPAAHYTPPAPPHEQRQQQQREDARRYEAAPTAFDFGRQQREANIVAAVPDALAVDERDELRERWKQPTSKGTGESLVSVLTGQMRARQMASASGAGSAGLPAPPQLRREAQQQYSSLYPGQPTNTYPEQPSNPYTGQSANSYPAQPPNSYPVPPTTSPPVRSRDLSPVVVMSATPHTTPPVPSPVSTSAYPPSLSPTHAYPPRYPSPRPQRKPSHSPTTAQPVYPRQDAPQYSRPSVSPTSPYPPHPTVPYTPRGDSPTTLYPRTVANLPPRSAQSPTHYSPCMQSVPRAYSHASPGTSPTASYMLPLTPSRPTSSRGVEMASPVPPPPPPHTPPPQPQLLPAPPGPVLQLQPLKPKIKHVLLDEERSFEDELLSLVDGDDIKPKISHPATTAPVPQVVPPPKSFPPGRKAFGSATKPKPKAPPKPRAPPKTSKAKAAATAVRHVSGTSTPVPGSSMPPPSPPPVQPAKQMPAVARAKGKTTGTGSGRKKGPTTARSRSLSVKPPESTPAPVEVETVQQDDRLYCLCKTPYEEEKIMIACDRCDEWYHPACVGMAEAEVDLVDQFICSSCGAQNPVLHTTYKPRCHRGLNYVAAHDTLPTCCKPARGAFSKYCSDECGIAHMRAKIAQSGHTPAEIWPAVKNARRREGVTIAHAKVNVKPEDGKPVDDMDVDIEKEDVDPRAAMRRAMKAADEREVGELRRRLEDVMRAREEGKLTLERVVMRRRLLDLAVERAGTQFCGWDARLEMEDKEWAGWVDTEAGRHALDGGDTEEDADWWCRGPAVCPRHKGWQTMRDLDVQLEVDSKNASIKQLTDRERELRRRIEDIEPPPAPLKSHSKSGGRKKPGKKSTR